MWLILLVKMVYQLTEIGNMPTHCCLFFEYFMIPQTNYCESENESLKVMATRMRMNYRKYWGDVDNLNVMSFIFVVLDPHYKLPYVDFMVEQSFDVNDAQKLKAKVKGFCFLCLSFIVFKLHLKLSN